MLSIDLSFGLLSLVPEASRAELMMLTISEIVNQLIEAHNKGEDSNLNK
jgi:elongator complex protein 3